MSSIGQLGNTTRYVDYNQQQQSYVIDGEAASEAEANAVLAEQGLTAVNGAAFIGGFSFDIEELYDVLEARGLLDEVMGSRAPAASFADKAEWADSLAGGSLLFESLMAVAQSATQDRQLAAGIRDEMSRQKFAAKDNALAAKGEEIDAKQKKAKTDFIVAVVKSVAEAVISLAGAGAFSKGSAAIGKGLETVLKIAGEVVAVSDKAYEAIDTTSGNQADIDAAQYRQQLEELMASRYETSEQSASENLEAAKEEFRKMMQLIENTLRQELDITGRITSIG